MAIGLRAETEGAAPPANDFVVTFDIVEQSAREGMDFVAPTLTLTYAFNATDFVLQNGRYVRTVSKDIEIVDDEVVESPQYFELIVDVDALPDHVTIPSNRVAGGIEILDDDTFTVSVDDTQAEEGEDIVATISADGVAEFNYTVTVSLNSAEATAHVDFVAAGKVVVFAAGDTEKTVHVETIEDDIVEPDETFEMQMLRQGLDGAIGYEQEPHAILTILNDDVPEWAVSVAPATIAEAGGTSAVTVSTGGVTFAAEQTIELEFAGTATAGSDFTVADAGGIALTVPYRLTLAVGESTVRATITAVDDDADDEDADDEDETIEVTAKLDDAQIGETRTITITDDGEATNAAPQFTSAASFSVNENQTAVGTVEATDADVQDEVSYALSGGADLAQFQIDAMSGELSFRTAPDYENPADAGGNNDYEVTVTATGGTGDRALTAEQTITVTVNDVDVDDVDEALPAVSIAVVADVVDEGDPAQFTLTLSAGAPAGGLTVSVLVSEEGSVLAAPGDYTAAVTVAFGAGDTQQTLSVATADDAVFEALADAAEAAGRITATVQAGTDYAVAADAGSATVTVRDDDMPAWAVTVDPEEIAEADTGAATVTVSTGGVTFAAERTIELEIAGTATAGSDFTVADAGGTALTVPYRLTLAVGESMVTATITAVDDDADDEDETIEVTAKLDDAQIGETRTITITDDDEAPADATLSALRLESRYKAVTLEPAFAPGEREYTATVSYATSTVVVFATPTAQDATVAFLDGDGAALPDAEPSEPGHAVSLEVGASTIRAQVSAHDGTTETYTVTVTRRSPELVSPPWLVSDPDASGADDDTYQIGDTIAAAAVFDVAVTVSGTPELELDVGGEARTAAYASGSGSKRLTFAYTVAEGDADADGVAIGADKLTAGGASIAADGTPAVLTHVARNDDDRHKVDGVRPLLVRAATTADGGSIVLTYDEELSSMTAGVGAFTVTVAGTARAVGTVAAGATR